jgi:hypothetical protein
MLESSRENKFKGIRTSAVWKLIRLAAADRKRRPFMINISKKWTKNEVTRQANEQIGNGQIGKESCECQQLHKEKIVYLLIFSTVYYSDCGYQYSLLSKYTFILINKCLAVSS